jgi:arginyl-tRNA synthetase
MILGVQHRVHEAVSSAIRQRFGIADVPAFAVETPPSRTMGDLSVTIAFQLARTLRKPPKAIAQEIVDALVEVPLIARVQAAPNGYLNLFLDRPAFAVAAARPGGPAFSPAVDPGKTIVEHTAINPNKAAHVGHLRNAALGDTLVRVLRFRGTPVEVQNYIDDTGVQVADVVVGFQELERQTLEGVTRIADTSRFDYYCWDLYSRVTAWYEGDRGRLDIRARALHDLERGDNDTAAMGGFVADRIVRAHLKTMARLNVAYDLLTYEGDILRLHFWARAFEILKAHGAVFLQTEGRLKGCWVMTIGSDSSPTSADTAGHVEGPPGEESREKVIVRSNGVVTYVGKDIANQFWKFGLLGLDFHYKRYARQQSGRDLWSTTSTNGCADAPPFGRAQRIYNVIDSRQMYLQSLLGQALGALGHAREADNSVHVSYEMVALSHATARELGFPSDPDQDKKPFVEVSGRKGLGVKIDDLLDLLTAKASAEVQQRNPDCPAEQREQLAAQIAVAAIRYFMLKFSRGKLIVFDMAEALSFEGETGPYLQYSVVRANNIFNKLRERDGLSDADVLEQLDAGGAVELTESDESDLWALIFESARLDEVVEQTVRALEFSVLAKYAFGLAQLFNAFYHRYPILNEEDPARKRWRAAGAAYFKAQLTRALDLMGIEVPLRM